MEYTILPNTNLNVSKICLGTMTFGRQNTQAEGHEQMDYALAQGVNFFDAAEMYPVPSQESTFGDTERIIGNWFRHTGRRDAIVLATKIAGPNRGLPFIREDLGYNAKTIHASVNSSLARLQTDYIDLYQLHWPERKVNFFGQRAYVPEEDPWQDNFAEVLEVLCGLQKAGKIRYFGVSNETPWGVMRLLEESKRHDLPKPATVQNAYSLVNRTFESGLYEICERENVGLLAYSPLAFGVLTGKYLQPVADPAARLTLFPNFTRYNAQITREASAHYLQIAQQAGMSLAQMALAFVQSRPFVSSTIIGATTMGQLKENLGSQTVILDRAVLAEIEKVQDRFPNPAP